MIVKVMMRNLISYLNKRGKVNKDLAYLLGYDFNRDRVGIQNISRIHIYYWRI